MPNDNLVLIIRPKDCIYCGNMYYGLGYVIDEIKKYKDVVVLEEKEAEKDNILAKIEEYDPGIVIATGHGTPIYYTANSCNPPAMACVPVITMDNCGLLSNRITHMFSCLTAISLGPEIMDKGAIAYSGYKQEWYWLTQNEDDGDPYKDQYAYPYFHSDNSGSIVLGATGNMAQATRATLDGYNYWIDYWLNNPNDDPYALEVAKWLIWDRDAYVDILAGNPQPYYSLEGKAILLLTLALLGGIGTYYFLLKKK